MLKVSLIVVKGKPEGKEIPVDSPIFVIGREEGCHLRPNSVEVSRRHVEIMTADESVTVRDLGSRNGSKVNGKLLTGPHTLKSGELLQVGPLTFAVSIRGGTTVNLAPPEKPATPARQGSLDDVPSTAIESWLISDNKQPTPDRQSGVYGGDTVTIQAYSNPPKPKEAEPDSQSIFENLEFEPLSEGEGDMEPEARAEDELDDQETEDAGEDVPDEMIDENNPFYIAKKQGKASAAGAEAASKPDPKAEFKDSSDAANDILRKMLERRRASR